MFKVLLKKWNKHNRLFTEEIICYCVSEKEAKLIYEECNKSANLCAELYGIESVVNLKNILMNNVTNEYELAKKTGCEVYCDDIGSYYEVWYGDRYLRLYKDEIVVTTFECAINQLINDLLDGESWC